MQTLIRIACALAATWPLLGTATASASADTDDARAAADYRAMLEDAERARAQAEAARRDAERAAQQARETARRHAETARRESEAAAQRDREEMERVQEELSRAHRELREATREIARAHREFARNTEIHRIVREVNLGERAVIGVVLGPETPEGVQVLGVSPGGPAEQAGLKAGDVILSIRGESLARGEGKAGRETLYRVMSETGPGEALAVVVDRDGESWTFEITAEQREPSSWQTLIGIPDAPLAPGAPGVAPAVPLTPGAPGAPKVIVEHFEHIDLPEIDEDALNERVRRLREEFEHRKFLFVTPDGEEFELDGDFEFPESFDLEIAEFSDLAEQALNEASIWFGLPQAQGLELARMNPGLGAYFETERGVLVLEAKDGNAYRLRPGDVILGINEREVDSPADLMRALREIEPGSEVELRIKRERRDLTTTVTMPENRLGQRGPFHNHD